MECLRGYIGLVGCGAPTPPTPAVGETLTDVYSGLTVNQLPGISLKKMDKIANSEQGSFLGVFNDAESRALLKFSIAAKSAIKDNYRITDSDILTCLVCKNKASFAVALWYLIGLEILIEVTSSERLNTFTTIQRDQAEDLKASFYEEYQSALKMGANSIDINKGGCIEDDCTECNSQIDFEFTNVFGNSYYSYFENRN